MAERVKIGLKRSEIREEEIHEKPDALSPGDGHY
jgi:hypothetical protein